MRAKKKTARVLQHQDGEQMWLDGFDELPTVDFIIAFEAAQESVAALLPRDRAAALTTRQLVQLTGQTPREITRRICAERRAGAPILSDPGAGFWLAGDADELKRCAQALHRLAGQIHKTARALEGIAKGRR
jgi:hypothetical protein